MTANGQATGPILGFRQRTRRGAVSSRNATAMKPQQSAAIGVCHSSARRTDRMNALKQGWADNESAIFVVERRNVSPFLAAISLNNPSTCPGEKTTSIRTGMFDRLHQA